MKNTLSTRLLLILAAAGIVFAVTLASAQQPPAAGAAPAQAPAVAPGQAPGGGRGGRGGGLPGATPEQAQALSDLNTVLAALNAAVVTARNDLATVTFAAVRNAAGITAAVEKLRGAELALATKRAEEFAKLQAGPNKLNPDQVKALIDAGGNPAAGGRGGRGRGGH